MSVAALDDAPYLPPTDLAAEDDAPLPWIGPDPAQGWIRRLLPLLGAHRRLVVINLVTALLAQLLMVAAPRVVMAAIDTALVARIRPLGPFVFVLVALALARLCVGAVHRYYLLKTGACLEYDLRAIVQEQLGRQSFSFFDATQTGQLISRANADIRSIERFLTFTPAVGIMFIGFAFAVALMFSIHIPLTFVAVATLPMVFVTAVRMRKVLFPVAWLVQARTADVATIVEENLAGAHVVRGMAAESQQLERLGGSAERLRWIAEKEAVIRARYQPRIQNLPRISQALVLLYGGYLVIQGIITIGSLVAFTAYIALLQQPFRVLGFVVMMAERAGASANRIFEIVDSIPDIMDRPGAVQLRDPRGHVRFDAVHFGYGDGVDVLPGFELTVAAGETVALVGATGSGKSTAARLVSRFYDVRSGRVTIDGHDVRDLTLDSLRTHVGIVTDDPFLFSDTVRANIAYGRPDAEDEEIHAAATVAGAAEFIDHLPEGYDTVVGERGYTLSGGQRQRIAIARALLVNPRVLILDDATSAIDVELELQIHAALEQLLEGRTTIVVAHRLSSIALADRVALVDDGRIIADGTHAELLATVPAYAQVLAHSEEEYAARREREEQARTALAAAEHDALMTDGGFPPGPGGVPDG